jgi:multiple antibiotic resistance protein
MPADSPAILAKLFALLFMLMGPVGVIPVFFALTRKLDRPKANAVAYRAASFAAAAVTLAGLIGYTVLAGWGGTTGSLIVAAGLLLMISAFKSVLGTPPATTSEAAGEQDIALSPLAFPTLVTAHAVGILIVFTAYVPHFSLKLGMVAVALGVVLLNLVAMLSAHRLMPLIGIVPLKILGAVFGVLQLAFGVELVARGAAMLTKTLAT